LLKKKIKQNFGDFAEKLSIESVDFRPAPPPSKFDYDSLARISDLNYAKYKLLLNLIVSLICLIRFQTNLSSIKTNKVSLKGLMEKLINLLIAPKLHQLIQ
jgi:hypothetical protein